MKNFISAVNRYVLLTGLSLSALTLSSCDKENILPATPGAPTTPTTPSPGTPPPVTNPPGTPPPNTTPPPVSTNSLLKQLGTKNFRYDAQNRLVELSYSDLTHLGYTVAYEGDKPVRLNFKTGGNYLIYTYDGDKVVEAVRYYGENLVNYRYKLEYSGNKLVKKTTMSYTADPEGRLGIETYTYDANGNLTEIVVAWSTSNKPEDMGRPYVISWGSYDNKPNPTPYAESDLYLPGVKLFENNPGYRDEELFTYTYHESGMPSQRYTRLQSHPSMPPLVTTYLYQ
ncbi:hypothetical protein [Pontibacter liquoris]|uniref:hypothetical protein n=1 Tax=Pontibacter liquoris TaxID=2905677 RepID=UPI001FA76BAD|nr:hypothetical protein [Pontibacter liquoris]